MTQPSVLIIGSCGLIGSEVALFFAGQEFRVTGIDNNHRAVFFGPGGDTSWALGMLRERIPEYRHSAIDIHDRGVELHGFLSHLVKCNAEGREYQVYGYQGKQARDSIRAEDGWAARRAAIGI